MGGRQEGGEMEGRKVEEEGRREGNEKREGWIYYMWYLGE